MKVILPTPSNFEKKLCSYFSEECAVSNVTEYRKRNQSNINKISKDIYYGKIAEILVFNYLISKGKKASPPDFMIYESKMKSFDADIKVEDVRKDNKIMITDQIGVVVRYPSMKDVLLLSTNADDKEVAFNVISSCIDMVFDAENVYDDFSHEEMKAWLDGLNQKQFEKVSSFFDKIPKLKYDVKWTCKKCKKQDHFVLEGLQSFFTYL